MLSLSTVFLSLSRISSWILNVFLLLPPQSVSWFQFYLRLVPSVKTSHLWPPSPFSFCSSGVNESRQVLQEQPDFAQSLLREPNTPIVRKSRGTSTQVGLQRQQWFKKKKQEGIIYKCRGSKVQTWMSTGYGSELIWNWWKEEKTEMKDRILYAYCSPFLSASRSFDKGLIRLVFSCTYFFIDNI